MVRYRETRGGAMNSEIEESLQAEAVRSDDNQPAELGHALAIIVPTTLLRSAAASAMLVPKLIADAGENASLRFLDFFSANIRNPNTRAAYAVAVRAFFAWLDSKHVWPLAAVRTHHVSAYIEVLGRRYRAPTVSSTSPRSACCSTISSSGRFSRSIPPTRCA